MTPLQLKMKFVLSYTYLSRPFLNFEPIRVFFTEHLYLTIYYAVGLTFLQVLSRLIVNHQT